MNENGTGKGKNWTTICVTLDFGLVEKLNDFCYKERLARSAVVEYALKRWTEDTDAAASSRLAKKIKSEGFDRTTRRNRYATKTTSKT
jgi:hypothetical protein